MNPLDFELSLLALYSILLSEDILRYVIFSGGVYLFLNIMLAVRLASRKIRGKNPPKGQIRREILASIRTMIIFATVGFIVLFGAQAGFMRLYFSVADYGLWYLIISSIVIIVLHDGYFYWAHRVLHRPRIFRIAHRLHHKSNNPTPFTAFAFDVGEALANAAFLPLVLLVMPLHPLTIFIFSNHMMLRNALGHSGYEIFPSLANGRPMFDWMTTVTHHDMHHAHAGWNLGLYFTWWDRWMGTEHPQYHDRFKAVVGGRRLLQSKRLNQV